MLLIGAIMVSPRLSKAFNFGIKKLTQSLFNFETSNGPASYLYQYSRQGSYLRIDAFRRTKKLLSNRMVVMVCGTVV